MRRGSVARAGLLVALGLATATPGADAEVLPTRGTFDGVYHRDRWGCATLGFMQFPAPLQERMARYEGRHVRVELKKGHQRTVPGPVVVDDLGEVQVLPEAAVAVSLRLVPPEPVADEPFQVVCTITNTSATAVSWHLRSPDDIQMSWAGERRGTVVRNEPRGLHVFSAAALGVGPVELPSGVAFAYPVEFEAGLPAGNHEFTGLAMRYLDDAQEQSFAAVLLDVKPGQKKDALSPLARGEAVVRTGADGAYEVAFPVLPGTGGPCWIAGTGSAPSLAGRVRGAARDGSPVAVAVLRDPGPGDRWAFVPLPAEGREVRFRVRQATRFPEKGLERLQVEILGSEGLMRVAEPVEIHEPPAPPQVPFGPAVEGISLRGRAADGAVEPGGDLRIHLQAKNGSGRPVVWRGPPPIRYEASTVGVEIDGKEHSKTNRPAEGIEGWALGRNCAEPREWTVRIPAPYGLAAGVHILRLTIRSKAGVYRNAMGEQIPLLEGELQSNDIEFTVR